MEMTAIGVPSLLFSTPFPFATGHRASGTSDYREKVRNRMDFIIQFNQKQVFSLKYKRFFFLYFLYAGMV